MVLNQTASGFDVIVCGSLHLDIVVRAAGLPKIDETAVGASWAQVCGGKGGNQAVQAARNGAKTAMIGRIGEDAFGARLRANLEAAGVDARAVTADGAKGSGMSVAIVQDDGEYGAVIVSGANAAMEPEAVSAAWSMLGGARALVLQNEAPQSVNSAAAALARQTGALVILNAAPARALPEAFLTNVDVLVVNRVEAEAMTGRPVANRAEACAALAGLTGARRAVVTTLGGEGLVLGLPSGEIIEIAPMPVKAVSTHGAGDCFVGALAGALAAGNSLEEACRKANARAGAFVAGLSD